MKAPSNLLPKEKQTTHIYIQLVNYLFLYFYNFHVDLHLFNGLIIVHKDE